MRVKKNVKKTYPLAKALIACDSLTKDSDVSKPQTPHGYVWLLPRQIIHLPNFIIPS